MKSSYVGVTGFMNQKEVGIALDALMSSKTAHAAPLLMVGVLASSKTLAGLTNKWPGRYPRVEEIHKIFLSDRRALNLIHYASDDRETLADQLDMLVKLGGLFFEGFQLNVVWPKPQSLEKARRECDRIVLQLGSQALAEIGNDPKAASERLLSYGDLITDILIDGSGGKGVPLDAQTGLGYLRAIKERHPDLGLGIAGGLEASTLDLLKPIVAEFPDVSIDAEGRLRSGDESDRLDLQKMNDYLRKAYHKIFREEG